MLVETGSLCFQVPVSESLTCLVLLYLHFCGDSSGEEVHFFHSSPLQKAVGFRLGGAATVQK